MELDVKCSESRPIDETRAMESRTYSGLFCGDIKAPFNIRTRHKMSGSPRVAHQLQCDTSVIADSESSPQSSPISATRQKRLTLFGSPHTPRSLVRRLSQGKGDSPVRWQRKCSGSGNRASRSPVCPDRAAVNVNPFTPDSRRNQSPSLRSAKQMRYWREHSSRYKSDFVEICRLGVGEFGDVFKVQNRLDGCNYAIKITKHPIRGSRAE